MSQNLTQPEEIDRILWAMAGREIPDEDWPGEVSRVAGRDGFIGVAAIPRGTGQPGLSQGVQHQKP